MIISIQNETEVSRGNFVHVLLNECCFTKLMVCELEHVDKTASYGLMSTTSSGW